MLLSTSRPLRGINSRADFRLPLRGGGEGEKFKGGFQGLPPPRGERSEGEERRGGGKGGGEKEKGEINSDFRLPPRGEERKRNSRADFRPPPMGEREEGDGERGGKGGGGKGGGATRR